VKAGHMPEIAYAVLIFMFCKGIREIPPNPFAHFSEENE
jgi:hypothetical protein